MLTSPVLVAISPLIGLSAAATAAAGGGGGGVGGWSSCFQKGEKPLWGQASLRGYSGWWRRRRRRRRSPSSAPP